MSTADSKRSYGIGLMELMRQPQAEWDAADPEIKKQIMLEMFEEKYSPMSALNQGLIDAMFPDVIELLNRLCSDALRTGKHQPDDWRLLGVEGNMNHMIAHFGGIEMRTGQNVGQTDERHLLNLACRALMVIQLQEEEKQNVD
jgi:hypothetical protein